MAKKSKPDFYYWNLVDNIIINGLIGSTYFELADAVYSVGSDLLTTLLTNPFMISNYYFMNSFVNQLKNKWNVHIRIHTSTITSKGELLRN